MKSWAEEVLFCASSSMPTYWSCRGNIMEGDTRSAVQQAISCLACDQLFSMRLAAGHVISCSACGQLLCTRSAVQHMISCSSCDQLLGTHQLFSLQSWHAISCSECDQLIVAKTRNVQAVSRGPQNL